MQHKIEKPGKLLDEFGNITEPGYATSLILDYDRKDIKAGKLRIKEWDYYLVYNDDYAVALTIADNSYMGLMSLSLIDFKTATETTKSIMTILPNGKTNLPKTSKEGDVRFENKKCCFEFLNDGKERKLKCLFKKFRDDKDMTVDFVLTDEPEDSMVIATPFEKPKYFYYNQKIVGMRAEGRVTLGEEVIDFNGDKTGAILDWGRGVWTYSNTWYWGAGCGLVDGKKVGFNIGYGFGDTSAASENMVFYDGKAHKLDGVTFNIPKDENGKEKFMEDWTFTSTDGRFEMRFTPIIDRSSFTSAVVIYSDQHQVFGKFNGTIILDDGKKVELKDYIGFAEKVINKW
ncbi:MAG: DUF2804 domain-containing protein [Clostridiales bacterium]|nr:DUF2804 domain-containing protein [Clostridiales bacterium]